MSTADLVSRLGPHLINHSPPGGEKFQSVPEAALREMADREGCSLKEAMIRVLGAGIWPERFRPQRGSYSVAEQARLLGATVAVIGLGGLGGAVCLYLARVGVGGLIVCDGDCFEESNLNRQQLSNLGRLGREKVRCAVEEIERINPAVEVRPWPVRADENNLPAILEPAQVVVDCLDNLPSRYLVEKAARQRGIPFIHGAVAGREGLLMTVFPDDPGLVDLYGPTAARKEDSAESFVGVPTVTPAMLAGLQAGEVVNILLGRPAAARRKLIHLDLSIPSIEHNELA
ncbi:MAG: HesA/MoeB/ThiF family protein [Thermodesulfobacteriota bacterium]